MGSSLIVSLALLSCTDKKAGSDFSGKTESGVAEKSTSPVVSEDDTLDAEATVETKDPEAPLDTPMPGETPSKKEPCSKATVTQLSGGTPNTVRNINFAQKVEVCGEKLSLIGSGIRQRAGDRYVLTAYAKTKTCDPMALINNDEPKYLKIDVLRDTSADLVSEAIGEALLANLPANTDAALRAQIDEVVAAFTLDFTVGLKVDMVHHADFGNSFRMDGKPEKVIPGKEVAKVLWSSFFSDNTCCASAKTEILAYCAQNQQ